MLLSKHDNKTVYETTIVKYGKFICEYHDALPLKPKETMKTLTIFMTKNVDDNKGQTVRSK